MAHPRQHPADPPDPLGVTPADRPCCRVAIRGGTVTLNSWTPAMADRGPLHDGLRHTRAALADLRRDGESDGDGEELIVTPVRGAPWDARAERALLSWARLVGYRRVWLPHDVVTFAGDLAAFGAAAVDCPTCGAHWEDDGLAFWETVRRTHWFPAYCLACGGSLPEWTLVEAQTAARRAEPHRTGGLRTTSRGGHGGRGDAPA